LKKKKENNKLIFSALLSFSDLNEKKV